jgi:hypothetical protein
MEMDFGIAINRKKDAGLLFSVVSQKSDWEHIKLVGEDISDTKIRS